MAANPQQSEKICVVGLGYVGLPLAVGLARRGFDVLGFDISRARVTELAGGSDHTGEIEPSILQSTSIRFSANEQDLTGRTMFLVTVPTPVDDNKQPDLGPMVSASKLVGAHIAAGACVVYESTVYPGVTEEICRPILANVSGLKPGVEFSVGYSPERINPGDKEHTLTRIVKIVSGEDEKTLERVAEVYGAVVDAGVFKATSIKVAEAAKVIENTQRDLNIALMNELAIIFDRLDIPTRDVLDAAGTKWNFLRFTPGLVGGHCISVDPYYFTAKAQQVGYHPEVILAGRRINDGMGRFVAQRLIKALLARKMDVRNATVAVLGITFKENVPDIRNTRVVDIIDELKSFGVTPYICDPMADPAAVKHEYDIDLQEYEDMPKLHAAILAVPHKRIVSSFAAVVSERLEQGGVVYDLKAALDRSTIRPDLTYLAL